jgi:formamidopyrimidine-DNA glycosylase
MPELPEVEATRRRLNDLVLGRAITKLITSAQHRGIAEQSLGAIAGSKIEAVRRRGKYLLLCFHTQILVIHLGMSGRVLVHSGEPFVPSRHDHLQLTLDDDSVIVFQDHRRFGRVLLSPNDLSALPPLGPDPTDGNLTPDRLAAALKGRRGALKPLLMSQDIIAGLGNIYACESLWMARLSPHRNADSLVRDDHQRLSTAITDVVNRAIEAGGATLNDYRGTTGEMGDFDQSFAVFAREGKPCPKCQSPITAGRIADRITYWCSICQR